jgi:hypothetical protein
MWVFFFIYNYMLKMEWYIEQPLDFEYKNYILLDYLQSVDKSFGIHQLSPYLLWTEKLISELDTFEMRRKQFLESTKQTKVIFSDGAIRLIKKTIDEPESVQIIKEIIQYSRPILESKVKIGYTLLGKYPQILW